MTKTILSIATGASLLFSSCGSNLKTDKSENKSTVTTETPSKAKATDIAFTVAKNYFVKNTVQSLDNPKIETAEKFQEVFGMATTMGKDGKPTAIDFNKQSVIALVLPLTDYDTSVEPVSLQKDESGKITLNYKKIVGQKQTYTIRPNLVIVFDKVEGGNVELKEQK